MIERRVSAQEDFWRHSEKRSRSRRSSSNSRLIVDLEPSNAAASSDVNRVSASGADAHWASSEYAASARAKIPSKSYVTTDEADCHEVAVLRVSLIGRADEEEQRHLL